MSREARNLERVKGLLRGEPHDSPGLDYDLTVNHVGLVARGVDPKQSLSEILRAFDCRLLLVEVDPVTVWGSLGRRGHIRVEEVHDAFSKSDNRALSVGVGESSHEIVGWRQTHRQAKASLPVAIQSAKQVARYADVCLIASAMQDTLLATSLREIYLQPLLVGRDGGRTHIQTLRAYFAAHRNGKSTAAALGVSRQAVANRLRVVEERLGRPLTSCAPAIEMALSLEEAGTPTGAAFVNHRLGP